MINLKKKTPKVSVCIIPYNQARYIRKCLQSVIDQAVDFDFEIIVGDDCSSDGTREIVREFEQKYPDLIKATYQEKNIDRGVTNYFCVHESAQGEFVAHLDGDDYFLPDKIKKQVNFLEHNSEYSVCWSRAVLVNDDGEIFSETKELSEIYPNGDINFSSMMRYAISGVHSSIMYRRSARNTCRPKFPTLDLYFSLEYLTKGKGKLINELLCAYRITSGTLSAKSDSRSRHLAAHHVEYFYKLHPAVREDVFIYAITNLLIDLKNKNKSLFAFCALAVTSFSLVGPVKIMRHIRLLRQFKA